MKTAMLIIMLFWSGPAVDHVGMANLAVCEQAREAVIAAVGREQAVIALCVEDE